MTRWGESVHIQLTMPNARYSASRSQAACRSGSSARDGPNELQWPDPRPILPDNRRDRDNCLEMDRARDHGGREVAHLGVQPAMQQTAIDQRASAQACSNRDIEEAAQTARGAPTGLGQRGGVHIGIENNRRPERPVNCPGKIEVLPGRFWRGGDVTEQGRFRIRIDRSERSDSNGRHRLAGRKKWATRAMVSSGVVVGNSEIWASSGPLPVAHRNFDPPASMPPKRAMSFRAPVSEAGLRPERQPYNKSTMKLSVFARVLALSGLAAVASHRTATRRGNSPAPGAVLGNRSRNQSRTRRRGAHYRRSENNARSI